MGAESFQRGVQGFETVFGTPHGLNPAAIAQAMGVSAKQITTIKELEAEVNAPISGVSVVVCDVPDRESNADNLQKIVEALSSI
jgi:2-succinyl-5-enolpyruvyl-6-hydroxy-3-cyclohexene-1-carboxylate synthase